MWISALHLKAGFSQLYFSHSDVLRDLRLLRVGLTVTRHLCGETGGEDRTWQCDTMIWFWYLPPLAQSWSAPSLTTPCEQIQPILHFFLFCFSLSNPFMSINFPFSLTCHPSVFFHGLLCSLLFIYSSFALFLSLQPTMPSCSFYLLWCRLAWGYRGMKSEAWFKGQMEMNEARGRRLNTHTHSTNLFAYFVKNI